jgi:hypothetical protein
MPEASASVASPSHLTPYSAGGSEKGSRGTLLKDGHCQESWFPTVASRKQLLLTELPLPQQISPSRAYKLKAKL